MAGEDEVWLGPPDPARRAPVRLQRCRRAPPRLQRRQHVAQLGSGESEHLSISLPPPSLSPSSSLSCRVGREGGRRAAAGCVVGGVR